MARTSARKRSLARKTEPVPWRNLHPDVGCKEVDLHYARALTYRGCITGYVLRYWAYPNAWVAVLTPRGCFGDRELPEERRLMLFPVLAQAKAHVMKEQRYRITAERQYWKRVAARRIALKEKNAPDQRQIA